MGVFYLWKFIRMKYQKPSLTFEEQYNLLKIRGLVISNKEDVLQFLSKVSYYRFSFYCRPFQSGDNHQFKKNTTFDTILNLYYFDNKLRILLLDLLAPVEILFRTSIAYYFK